MRKDAEYRSMDLMDMSVDTEASVITGRAVVYNSSSVFLRTINGDKFKEIILPGALTESLKVNDVLALKEHNPELILGRRSAGTLTLEDKADGLWVTIKVPDTSYGEDLLESCKRGDVKGFSFLMTDIVARTYTNSEGVKIREISKLNLLEVSVVSAPAYPDTILNLRSEDFVPEQVEVRAEEKKEAVQQQTAIKPEVHKDYELRFRFNTLAEAQPRASKLN